MKLLTFALAASVLGLCSSAATPVKVPLGDSAATVVDSSPALAKGKGSKRVDTVLVSPDSLRRLRPSVFAFLAKRFPK